MVFKPYFKEYKVEIRVRLLKLNWQSAKHVEPQRFSDASIVLTKWVLICLLSLKIYFRNHT